MPSTDLVSIPEEAHQANNRGLPIGIGRSKTIEPTASVRYTLLPLRCRSVVTSVAEQRPNTSSAMAFTGRLFKQRFRVYDGMKDMCIRSK